jgi:hypothetical protein
MREGAVDDQQRLHGHVFVGHASVQEVLFPGFQAKPKCRQHLRARRMALRQGPDPAQLRQAAQQAVVVGRPRVVVVGSAPGMWPLLKLSRQHANQGLSYGGVQVLRLTGDAVHAGQQINS